MAMFRDGTPRGTALSYETVSLLSFFLILAGTVHLG